MSDLRLDFAGVLRDEVNACGDREMVRELPSLQAAWDGSWALSPEFRAWYMTTFLGQDEASRVLRGLRAVEVLFLDRNRVRFEMTGAPRPIDHELVAEIQTAVVNAMYPSAYRVAMQAIHHPANRVAAALNRLGATEERWREKYS